MNDVNWSIPEEETPQAEVPDMRPEPSMNVATLKPVFDIERATKEIETRFMQAVDDLVRQAAGIKVSDDQTAKQATELGALASRMNKQINALVKELTEDATDFIKRTKAKGESFTSRLSLVYNNLVKKLTEYNNWLELERRKQEEIARKATEQFQQTLNAEAEKAGVEAPIVAAPIIPEQKTNIKTEGGSTAFTGGRWKCTVVDEGKVPREYCSPDSKKLNAAIRAGVREIAGCEIKKDEKVRIRT